MNNAELIKGLRWCADESICCDDFSGEKCPYFDDQKTHAKEIAAYQKAYREAHPEKVKQWRKNAVVAAYNKIKAEEQSKE